jgi:hypothetical protein
MTTSDKRWEPGAAWELFGERHVLAKTSYAFGLPWAHFPGMTLAVELGEMTPASGWRYLEHQSC